MPRDGSGTFTRSEGPYVNGTIADADEVNNEFDDVADGLTESVNINGTKAFAANQPMGGFVLTGLGAGASNGQSVRYEQLTALSGVYQPLDATLTALAALSWSSLTPVLQFTAADTVSLTSAPKVTTLELGDATDATLSRSGAGLLAVEGNVIALLGTANSFTQNQTLSKSAPTWTFNDTAAGTNYAVFSQSNSLRASKVGVTNLFVADESLFDIQVPYRGRIALSSETSGTLTSASANKKVLASGGITLNDGVFTAHDAILIDANGTARTITRDTGCTMYVAGVDSATATLAANGVMTVNWRTAAICILSGDIT